MPGRGACVEREILITTQVESFLDDL